MHKVVSVIPSTSSLLTLYFSIFIGSGLLILGIYIAYLIIRALKIYIKNNDK